jgi:hypothetical protein
MALSFLKAWYLLLSVVYSVHSAPISLSCQEAQVAIGFQLSNIHIAPFALGCLEARVVFGL